MNENTEIAELLFNEGTLFDLDIGRWAAIKKLKPTEVLLDDIDEQAVYLGHKRLLPKEALKDIVRLEGKARSQLEAHSSLFPIAGARFVYLKTLSTLIDKLSSTRIQYMAAVEQLIVNYPTHKEHQLERLNKMADSLYNAKLQEALGKTDYAAKKTTLDEWLKVEKESNESKYPDVSSLQARFRFDWHIFKISQFNGDGTTLSQEQVEEAQRRLQNELRNWIREATASMHQTLGEAALQAKNLLQKHGRLNPRSLKPLFDAFETFKAIDFTGASDMQQVIDQAKSRFGIVQNGEINYEATAEYLSSGGGAEFGQLLDTMSQLAVTDTAQKAGLAAISRAGRFARVIED